MRELVKDCRSAVIKQKSWVRNNPFTEMSKLIENKAISPEQRKKLEQLVEEGTLGLRFGIDGKSELGLSLTETVRNYEVFLTKLEGEGYIGKTAQKEVDKYNHNSAGTYTFLGGFAGLFVSTLSLLGLLTLDEKRSEKRKKEESQVAA